MGKFSERREFRDWEVISQSRDGISINLDPQSPPQQNPTPLLPSTSVNKIVKLIQDFFHEEKYK